MEEVLRAAGTKLAEEHIGKWEVTVSKWVALHPLLEVCVRLTGCKAGGGVRGGGR